MLIEPRRFTWTRGAFGAAEEEANEGDAAGETRCCDAAAAESIAAAIAARCDADIGMKRTRLSLCERAPCNIFVDRYVVWKMRWWEEETDG